jgi:hypothetical protein
MIEELLSGSYLAEIRSEPAPEERFLPYKSRHGGIASSTIRVLTYSCLSPLKAGKFKPSRAVHGMVVEAHGGDDRLCL